MLSPLLSMNKLETLDLCYTPVALVPADIEPMARAWPQIKCLRLYDMSPEDECPTKYLQVEDLLPFARFCPELRMLGLPIRIVQALMHTTMQPSCAELELKLERVCVAIIRTMLIADAVKFFCKGFPKCASAATGWDGTDTIAPGCMNEATVEELYEEQSQDLGQ